MIDRKTSDKKYREKNRKKYNNYKREFLKTDKGRAYHRNKTQRRKARELNQLCTCCENTNITTFYRLCPEGYHVDHIIPLVRGGLHCIRNLQYMRPDENLAKGANIRLSDIEAWFAKNYVELGH